MKTSQTFYPHSAFPCSAVRTCRLRKPPGHDGVHRPSETPSSVSGDKSSTEPQYGGSITLYYNSDINAFYDNVFLGDSVCYGMWAGKPLRL